MNTTFYMGILGWDWNSSGNWKHSLRYNLSKLDRDFTAGFLINDQNIWINHVRDELSYIFSDRLKCTLGADMLFATVDAKFIGIQGITLRNDNPGFKIS